MKAPLLLQPSVLALWLLCPITIYDLILKSPTNVTHVAVLTTFQITVLCQLATTCNITLLQHCRYIYIYIFIYLFIYELTIVNECKRPFLQGADTVPKELSIYVQCQKLFPPCFNKYSPNQGQSNLTLQYFTDIYI